jgi:hypothetical protein
MTMTLFLGTIGLTSLVISYLGYQQSARHQNSFTLTRWLYPWGIFVWGDALILGMMWAVLSLGSLILHDAWLFISGACLFWLVRSLGETVYWLNQQFSSLKRNNPQDLWGHQLWQGDGVWFGYQLFWQVMTVIFSLASIYSVAQWLAASPIF